MPDPATDLLEALVAAQFALVAAADRIHSREGHSFAYCCAANASHAARDAVIKYRRATNAN